MIKTSIETRQGLINADCTQGQGATEYHNTIAMNE